MPAANQAHRTIAIIGGGVSGALTAYQLTQQTAAARITVRIVIIDPRPELGLGLAFSTPSLRHLLNVPTGKISALPHEPDHFLNWYRANHDPEAKPFSFAPRAIFGQYVRSIYAEVADSVEHIQVIATDLRKSANGLTITFNDGSTLRADYAVLATGNFDPPMLPNIDPAAIISGLYCNNAWVPGTYDSLAPDAIVTLIGTGLTAVDVVLRLRELGHRGQITAVSRHGLFSARHVETALAAAPVIDGNTPATALSYLRAIRAAMRSGMPWRAAIDSIRTTTNDLWLALPPVEQQRFRRHLMHRWYIVRHRMAPAIADVIDAELAAGTLTVCHGSFAGLTINQSGNAEVGVRAHYGNQTVTAARIINCTGPSTNYRKVASPLMQSLFAQGIATPGPHLGAFNTTASGVMIDANGQASEVLFNLGPGRLGTVIETIAIPEIRQQAFEIASLIAARIAEIERRVNGRTKLPGPNRKPRSGAPSMPKAWVGM